jgi:hypothetical protein
MQFGWFYDGHQALADCKACLALLAQTLPKSGQRVMAVVREVALRDDYLVRAVDAPCDLRDKLKLYSLNFACRPAYRLETRPSRDFVIGTMSSARAWGPLSTCRYSRNSS